MKKKNGFTLIELLAVIVILAIIALIAVPVIMNILNKANKSAFKDTAYGLVSAGELYFAGQQLELNGMSEDATFTFPTDEIDIKGEIPAGTVLKVNTEGKTALAMTNGRYCITKGFDDTDVTVTEDVENCSIPGEETKKTLKDLAVVSTELGVNSIETCVEQGQVCEIDEDGVAFAIKVNNKDTYKFYVLSDDGDNVKLIMASNLYAEGSTTSNHVSWSTDILVPDTYYDDNGNGVIDEDEIITEEYDNTVGPTDALEALKERTANWTNLDEYSYTLKDSAGRYPDYSGEYVQNVRARLPRLSDMVGGSVGCAEDGSSCPNWIYEGLYNTGDKNANGYWLSDASTNQFFAWGVNTYFGYNDRVFIPEAVGNPGANGVRPVITLTK